jgi:type IV secretory pathway VirB2 component (pilin)
MIVSQIHAIRRGISLAKHLRWTPPIVVLTALLFAFPSLAFAQIGGSPFESGFTALQTLFTGTIAKVASLIAIVIGGYGFAHGEPGAKKNLAGVAAGTGIAVLATNILSWLWGM